MEGAADAAGVDAFAVTVDEGAALGVDVTVTLAVVGASAAGPLPKAGVLVELLEEGLDVSEVTACIACDTCSRLAIRVFKVVGERVADRPVMGEAALDVAAEPAVPEAEFDDPEPSLRKEENSAAKLDISADSAEIPADTWLFAVTVGVVLAVKLVALIFPLLPSHTSNAFDALTTARSVPN